MRSADIAPGDYHSLVERRLRSVATIATWSLMLVALLRLTSHGIFLAGSPGALRIGDVAWLATGTTYRGRGQDIGKSWPTDAHRNRSS